MAVVNTTSTMQIEPQNLAELRSHPNLYFKNKNDRRRRDTASFRQVILFKPRSRALFLVYASGKCVILGCRSQKKIRRAGRWLAKTLGSRVVQKPRLRNIVYVFKTKAIRCSGDLIEMVASLMRTDYRPSFEPEISPALMLSPSSVPLAKVMIFRTGKVNVTGLTSFKMIRVVKHEIRSLFDSIKS